MSRLHQDAGEKLSRRSLALLRASLSIHFSKKSKGVSEAKFIPRTQRYISKRPTVFLLFILAISGLAVLRIRAITITVALLEMSWSF